MYQFRAKDSEIKKHSFCFENISGDSWNNNMTETRLNESVYDFPLDYRAFNISDITNIHKYFMKKHDTK